MKRQLGRGHVVAAARPKFTRALASLFLIPACAALSACGAGPRPTAAAAEPFPGGAAATREARPYSTWQSLGERPVRGSVPGAPEAIWTAPALSSGGTELGGFPVGGIASHHLLAHAWIEAWFAELARARTVETFFIVSPRHFGQSGGVASMSLRPFAVSDGLVEVDAPTARRVAERLGTSFDDASFTYEHGVSTFMPFIARHFPDARVVPLAVDGEAPVDLAGARALAGALLPEFRDGAERRAFLLVSSDFSHHDTKAEADRRDAISRRFVERPSADTWFFAGCDNRPGMYALGALADGLGAVGRVLWRTTALDIAPEHVDPRDVTSYFFSFAALAEP
ncbi:MAG: AmmeMemoRadiSam system protein B [Spirochaetales bacterium]|nr:AmmeMemoRadiSam system protein B [Spirochaetales bacterium]